MRIIGASFFIGRLQLMVGLQSSGNLRMLDSVAVVMPLPRWIFPAAAVATFAGVLWFERTRPLRARVEPANRRAARNFAVALAAAATLQIAEKPVVGAMARLVERRRWGLLQRMPLPPWLETVLGLLLLDYTLYVWHVLLHRMSVLWRFHVVHHTDRDLDATTALRFHFGELALSVPWRAAQILLIGVQPRVLRLWQRATLASVIFHHSNVRLPLWLERRLVWFFVTPRMHGIHHSMVQQEANSNWSSGLALWDRLHGTLRLDVPQGAITIGVPAYLDPQELTLGSIIAMPFKTQRLAWRRRENSEITAPATLSIIIPTRGNTPDPYGIRHTGSHL